MTATLVMGFVIEQIRKRASDGIGIPASRSSMPCDLSHATLPCRTTIVTAPAICLSAILLATDASIRWRRTEERPTDSGEATAICCALRREAETASGNKIATAQILFGRATRYCIVVLHDLALGLAIAFQNQKTTPAAGQSPLNGWDTAAKFYMS